MAGLTLLHVTGPERAFGQSGAEVIPWLDQPATEPHPGRTSGIYWNGSSSVPGRRLPKTSSSSTTTANPASLDEATWRLDIGGLVAHPRSLTLRRPQGAPAPRSRLHAGVLGQPRIRLLHRRHRECPLGGRAAGAAVGARRACWSTASEVVFWGADQRDGDNPRQLRDRECRADGIGERPMRSGGIDLTITEQFARSMSVEEALSRDNLLCYEMNGEPLPPEHGFPLRLIAPGWYGVANVKWLTRIEVIDHRFTGRFMARDYVTIREGAARRPDGLDLHHRGPRPAQVSAGQSHAPGNRYSIMGAAWGAPIGGGGGSESMTGPGSAGNCWIAVTRNDRAAMRGCSGRSIGERPRRRASDPLAGDRRGRQCAASAGRPLPCQQEDLLGEATGKSPAG